MHGRHLRKRGDWWHYYRNRPRRFRDVEPRAVITFALRTTCISEAKLKAAQYSSELEHRWECAKIQGVSLASTKATEKYAAAIESNRTHGFIPKSSEDINDDELLTRLRYLLSGSVSQAEQSAILGFVEKPKLSLTEAFERFWAHIEDEWINHSHDQCRGKRNVYLKSIRHFEESAGKLALYDINRQHAHSFRAWWLERKKTNNLKSYTANREIGCLRRLISTSFEIDGYDRKNPFTGVKLKEEKEVRRKPLSREDICNLILAPGKLDGLHIDFQLLIKLVINTGMRPVEAIGLELCDIDLQHEVPHVIIRQNSVRVLKTKHSERNIPLTGVSLVAARQLVNQGGWGKRLGKNMYATSIINRHFKTNCTFQHERQSFYSLRHWFQDQLTQRNVVDRIQCQLMGHKFNRPTYGDGAPLEMLRDIIADFAL